jgi:hypothetical protein
VAITKPLRAFIAEFDGALINEEYNSQRYCIRLIFTRKLVNRPGQADRVVEFVAPNSESAKAISNEYWVTKEVEKPKFRPTDVVRAVQAAGFRRFRVAPEHLGMWKSEDAKNPSKGYGVAVQGAWYSVIRHLLRPADGATSAVDGYGAGIVAVRWRFTCI